jgi:serine/threonine protein phosphatase PrpC
MRPDRLLCPSCGAAVAADDRFCEDCGARVARSGEDERAHAEIDLGIVAGVTDRGLQHPRNEDALFISRADRAAVVVVCDGVSSSTDPHEAAQVAADAAGRSLVSALREQHDSPSTILDSWDPQAATVAAIHAAQDAVISAPASIEHPDDPPACTFVSAMWDGRELTVGWVGDSRAYWIAPDEARRVTVDDAWKDSHTLTRWLGADAPGGEPGVTRFEPEAAGRVIVCSDGLWNYVEKTEELAALVSPAPEESPIALAQKLTRTALAAGGQDNITVAVLTIERDGSSETSERGAS